MTTRRTILFNGLALGSSALLGARLSAADPARDAGETPLTVAVLGATGRTGKFVVEDLLARGHAVRGISRRAGAQPPQDGVTWISADVRRPESMGPALEGVDALIYAVGVTFSEVEVSDLYDVYHTGVADTADVAIRTGVKRFVLLSSAGRSPAGWMPERLAPSMDAKARGEAALRASGIHYTISRTPGLSDRPGGEYGIMLLQAEPIPPGGPFMICREDSASVLVECAVSEKAINKTFTVLNAITPEVGIWRDALQYLQQDPV
ncbi:MAG: NAD(P)H-binding protein [Gammaproteobacteria bacterium]|nr:NAD(P)H-binding protein [Gammaproteobacteria bacterium]MXW46935.1 NAD(P)H-binding protein [Gammaproteobacteria bacterium]MYD02826.1 NAD(P)H-binding protein [Gammaproteobacteria bacterium]MYI24403.1 NAD(P)H-binding protein [Gammaproteobacteria bacterium]